MQRYIDWETVRYLNQELIDPLEMSKKILEIKADPMWVLNENSKTKYSDWHIENKKVYRVNENKKYIYLSVCDNTIPDEEFKYKVWVCHKFKTKETIEEAKKLGIKGFQCRSEILKSFKKHNDGMSMVKAFGTTSSDEFRYLVPKPVYYLSPNKRNYFTNIEDGQYIDVSSMYPACACGKLPTTKGMIRLNGRVEPTEDYPFAFYLKSHHCAEYGVFDTHEYLNLRKEYYMWQCFTDKPRKAIYNHIEDDDEITVLMPASEYEMTDVFEEIYAKKCAGDPLSKAIANKGIGALHRAPNERKHEVLRDYYHLAAIILGRANAKMHAMVHKIEYDEGYEVLSCIVDSIIYRGEKNFGINEKVLGAFYNEFGVNTARKGIILRMTDCINKYVIADKEDPKKILKYVLSGIPTSEQHIEKLEDIDKYFKKGA